MSSLLRRLAASACSTAGVTALFVGLFATSTVAAPLSAGNVVVELLTGTSGSSTAINLVEYTTSGSLSQTIALPSSGSTAQTDSASASSNGYFNIFGTAVAVPGVNIPVNTASANTSNNKAVTFLSVTTGSITAQALTGTGGPTGVPPTPFSGNNFRSVISTNGTNAWLAGTSSGSPSTGAVWYYDGTGVNGFTRLSGDVNNVRNVEVYGTGTAQRLFVSTGSGTGSPTMKGIYTVGTGLPTSGTANAMTSFIATGTAATVSPYGFVLFSTGSQGSGVLDLAYIADDGSGTGGGLQKWTFNGSSWTNQWSLLVNASNQLSGTAATGFAGVRGLAGSFSGGAATLFATTSESSNNRLISILDNGTPPSSATGLATAGVNQVFRGVDLVPVPEPTSIASLGCAVALYAVLRRRRRVA